jgi:hypothetical protein
LDAILARHPTDEDLLRALATYIRVGEDRLRWAREVRDETAMRLRAAGKPMTEIALLAGVSDSYLTRKAVAAGSPRRPRTPPRRNHRSSDG